MRKLYFLLIAVASITANSVFGQMNIKVETKNLSDKINDGVVSIKVEGGAVPYKYLWSNAGTDVYTYQASGVTEGEEQVIKVVDANGDTSEVKALIEAESIAEKMNAGMKPVVNFMGAEIFFVDVFSRLGLYDPTIMVSEADIATPLQGDTATKSLVVSELLVADGAQVKDGQPIIRTTSNRGVIDIYSIGNGTISFKVKEGDILKTVNDKGESEVAIKQVAHIEYSEPQPLQQPNGSDSSTSIPLVVVWLVFGAIFFTVRMKFINIRGAKHAVELVQGKFDDPDDQGEVSHFQALTTALSGTVGLGNIASVAIAISIGGPGATFWMILAGLLGMSSKFVECTLGVKYREISEDGEVHGGPMYYLSKGLAKKNLKGLGKVLAALFAILCIGGSFGGGNMFQANQAFAQFSEAVGGWEGGGPIFGVIMAILVGIVIIGGIKSIAKVTDKIVPFMVTMYVLFALIIIFANIANIGDAFGSIFSGAFSADAAKGGFIGVLIIGFQRAAFSNEAGVGSASIAHSAARTKEPVSEGIVALLEPFIDTVVVCTMTALVLIFTGFAADNQGLTGANLTSAAFSAQFGWFKYMLTIAIILFAFSTMISWSYYGLKAWGYLFGRSKTMSTTYKVLFLVFVFIGSSIGLGAVLDFSDMMVLGMAFPNVLGLILMSGEVKADMQDYFARIKSGAIKRFK